jgi:hypothetical protein
MKNVNLMAREANSIDLSTAPALAQLGEEVQRTNTPPSVRRDGEEVAVLVPARRTRVRRGTAVDDQTGEGKKTPSTARPRRRGQPLTSDDPLFRTIGIGVSGVPDVSANKHHYLAEAYLNKGRRRTS